MLRLFTVSELNAYLAALIDADEILADLWVEGEVFDFRQATSGHWYFKLRQGDAALGAACWRSHAARIGAPPRNGDSVLAHGRVGFYEASGALQLYVDMLRPAGVGILHARFEELKARLGAEGLFDGSRKRPLPPLPRRIGVVTSPAGAALQDILKVLGRRYPLAEVVLAPCQVQGGGSAESVVEALYALYQQEVDVIIVARGGGSAEDLWSFNEEVVARAVFASPVPVVSGVGHETDTTIIDFVADVRAPTPSAAAELVTPTVEALAGALDEGRARLTQAIAARLDAAAAGLSDACRRLAAHAPSARIARDRQAIDDLMRRAGAQISHRLSLGRVRLEGLRARAAALSPQATLDRGYAVVWREADGQVVTEPAQLAAGEPFEVTVRGGVFTGVRGVE
jgi:exodeoxyribonuclease VII large subunit